MQCSTAMALHALALAQPGGWKRQAALAQKWLWSVQPKDGSWTEPRTPGPVYLTVLVLDAIALANGEKDVTFNMPPALRKRSQQRDSRRQAESGATPSSADQSGQYQEVKTRKSRRAIPLSALVARVLGQVYEYSEFKEPHAPVFAGRNGTPIDAHNELARRLKPALVKLKLPAISWHDLRDSAATFADQAGLTESERQRILGHASGRMTQHYTKANIEHPWANGVDVRRIRESDERNRDQKEGGMKRRFWRPSGVQAVLDSTKSVVNYEWRLLDTQEVTDSSSVEPTTPIKRIQT